MGTRVRLKISFACLKGRGTMLNRHCAHICECMHKHKHIRMDVHTWPRRKHKNRTAT